MKLSSIAVAILSSATIINALPAPTNRPQPIPAANVKTLASSIAKHGREFEIHPLNFKNFNADTSTGAIKAAIAKRGKYPSGHRTKAKGNRQRPRIGCGIVNEPE